VNAIAALSEGKVKIMPDVLVTGGGGGTGTIDGLAAMLLRNFQTVASAETVMPAAIAKDNGESKPVVPGV
jgi:hypothetical protein